MYCSGLHLLKEKSEAELQDAGGYGYNLKLIPLLSRFGELLDYGDYINIKREGRITKMSEGPTRNELIKKAETNDTGFEISAGENQPDFPAFKIYGQTGRHGLSAGLHKDSLSGFPYPFHR